MESPAHSPRVYVFQSPDTVQRRGMKSRLLYQAELPA
jgi:hypothetical protein